MDAVAGDTGQQLPWYKKDLLALYTILTGNFVNLLLVCVPLGIASFMYDWGAVPTFVLVSPSCQGGRGRGTRPAAASSSSSGGGSSSQQQ
jgi:hypothetical protein